MEKQESIKDNVDKYIPKLVRILKEEAKYDAEAAEKQRNYLIYDCCEGDESQIERLTKEVERNIVIKSPLVIGLKSGREDHLQLSLFLSLSHLEL